MPMESRGRGDVFICTADDPWSKEKCPEGVPVVHADAVSGEDRDFGGGCYCASYKCPHCGLHFYVELPQ